MLWAGLLIICIFQKENILLWTVRWCQIICLAVTYTSLTSITINYWLYELLIWSVGLISNVTKIYPYMIYVCRYNISYFIKSMLKSLYILKLQGNWNFAKACSCKILLKVKIPKYWLIVATGTGRAINCHLPKTKYKS